MGKVLRLLVVEDYESDYALIVRLLNKAGYEVHATRVETAQEMQEALERQTWDVVIADYRLPQFDAPAALELLHQSGLDLPFIIISGTVGEEIAVAMMRAGAHDYLMKDNLLRLAPAVERELQEAQMRRERRQAQTALQARNRILAQLNQAGRAFSATLDLDQVLAAIMAETHRLLEVTAASLWLVDPATQTLTCCTATGPGAAGLMGRRLPCGVGIAGQVAQHAASLIVADMRADALPGPAAEESPDPSLRSLLSVPLCAREKVIGVLQVLDTRADRFTADDQQTLELLAASAAIALENARLYQQAQQEIAERKRAEEALLASEQRYRSLFEGVPIGLYRTAADGRVLAANPALAEMLGYSSPEELLGLNAVDFYTDPAKRAEQQERLAREGIIRQSEIELRRRDGRRLWALDTFRAVRDSEGRVLWNEGSIQDITERKHFEEALRQKSRDLTALLEISQALAATLNLDKVLQLIVERATGVADLDTGAIYLLREGELHLAATTPPSPPDFPDEFCHAALAEHPYIGRALASGEPVVLADANAADLTPQERAICTARGLRTLLFLPLLSEKDAVGVLIVGTVGRTRAFTASEIDLYRTLAGQATLAVENARLYDQIQRHAVELEQRVAERTAELRTQYAFLEAILNSASDGVLVTTTAGEIIRLNPVAQRWLNETLSTQDADRLRQAIGRLTAHAARRPTLDLELTGLDLQMHVAPITGTEADEPLCVVTLHDVSQLKQLDRMRAAFVSNVSHELRTPVTTIKLAVGLLRRQPKEKWDPFLTMLELEAERQARLVEEILQLSRIEAGRLELHLETLDLNSLVRSLTEARQLVADARGLALTHVTAAHPLPVHADPGRLSEVFNNLIENAIWYTPAGGQIVVSTAVETLEGQQWAVCRVSDTGMGIPAEELPLIFERFYRGERPRAMQIAGTGLGLSIAQELVALHGGQITVESKVNKGSTFTVWLPLAQDAQLSLIPKDL